MDPPGDDDLALLAHAAVVEHGDDAPSFAHRRAAESLRKRDRSGARRWWVVGQRARHILSWMSRARH